MSDRFAAPPSLVDALVSEDSTLAAAAYAELRRRVLRCRHPAVTAGTPAQRDELVQEVATMLTREPAASAAATVYTWAGLDTAIRRWIDQCRGDSIEDRATAYREHLWRKLGALLSDEGAFARVPMGAAWGYVLAEAPVGEGVELSSLLGRLRPRSPVLRARRDDQLAELITADALRAVIDEVYRLGGNAPRSRATLVEAVLHALGLASGPRLSPLDDASPDTMNVGVETSTIDGLAELSTLAERFVRSLPPRTRRAAALRFAGPSGLRTLEEVARALGTSRGTAENEVGDARGRFAALLRAFAREESLDEDARSELLAAIFERLARESTEPLEETR